MAISSYQSYEMGPALTCTVLQTGEKCGRVIQGSATSSQFINGKCLVFMYHCLLDTMLWTRNDLFSLLGSKTWMMTPVPPQEGI